MKKFLLTLLIAICFTDNKAQVLNTSFCQINSGGYVNCVVIDSINNVVYIGGSFTQVCLTARKNVAALDLTTGALLPWNPGPDNTVNAMYIHHNALYIGGIFTHVGVPAHNYAAKFSLPSGAVSPTWTPNITSGPGVNSITAKDNKVYLGGNFLLTIGTGKNICELDTATAAPTSWAAYPDNAVYSLSIDGNSLYAGGNFSNIGATAQNNLAKFYLTGSGGTLSSWNPDPDAKVNAVLAVSGRVFVGGWFFSFNAGADNRSGLAEIDSSSGFVRPWNPGCDGGGATQILYRKGIIYALGASTITTMGGKLRSPIGAIDVNTGIATHWNINANASLFGAATTSSQIFMGGAMTSVLGQTSKGFAVVCINPIDTITSAPDGPTTVCQGVTGMSYSVAPVNGATTYTWTYSGTGATINGTSNAVTIDFSNTATSGTLSVKATNNCETSNTQTVSISTYSFTASVSANSNNITCGDSVDINSSDNYQGSGTITYSWAPSAGLNATNVYKVTSGTKATRTYTLTETSSEGCVAKDFTTITVAPFNLNASDYYTSGILCSTKDTLYVTNDYPGFGTVTYTWSPSASLNLPHAAKATASPVVSTDYTITASASDGCTATMQSVFVTVDPISLNTGSILNPITCGDATQLSATNNYPGLGVLTYTWAPSTALSNTHITNPTANPTASTDYTLTLHSPEGCVSTNDAFINVDALQINLSSPITANCHAPTTLSTNANSTNAGLTYTWTPATGLNNSHVASPVAIVGQNTTYNVTMALPSTGCTSANNSITINITNPNGLQLCMVTVDSASTHNIVYWDKTGLAGAAIDSFRIYREITTNVYGIVGTVHYNALSEFHDFAANPNVTTYRYKISALDSCGLESPLSLYHNTVYIINVGNGQYTWNPGYTIESTTNPVNNYLLMRDNINNGTWIQVASTSGSQNTIADPAWASFPLANWQVVTAWSISCSPTAKQANGTLSAIVKSKSNISNNRPTSIKNTEAGFNVYPNPTNGNLTIGFTNSTQGKVNVKVVSVLGEEIYNETFAQTNETLNVDLSIYANGIYLMQITTNNTTIIKRIVKN